MEKNFKKRVLAVEQIAVGHPDTVCDVIAGSLVDAFVSGDSKSRCGIEVMLKDNIVVLGGEVFSNTVVDYDSIVRSVFKKIVYPENHHLALHPLDVLAYTVFYNLDRLACYHLRLHLQSHA